jgi:hypothetical protein
MWEILLLLFFLPLENATLLSTQERNILRVIVESIFLTSFDLLGANRSEIQYSNKTTMINNNFNFSQLKRQTTTIMIDCAMQCAVVR